MIEPTKYHELVDESGTRAVLYNIFADALARKLDESWLNLHYTHRNVDGSFGRLWQEPAQDMHRILKEWEIQFAEGWDLIPDHIAVELFFMGNLCRLGLERAGNEEEVQRLLEWQKQIFLNHLRPWVFEFLINMEHNAETDFYRGVAKLLHAFLLEESEALVTG